MSQCSVLAKWNQDCSSTLVDMHCCACFAMWDANMKHAWAHFCMIHMTTAYNCAPPCMSLVRRISERTHNDFVVLVQECHTNSRPIHTNVPWSACMISTQGVICPPTAKPSRRTPTSDASTPTMARHLPLHLAFAPISFLPDAETRYE